LSLAKTFGPESVSTLTMSESLPVPTNGVELLASEPLTMRNSRLKRVERRFPRAFKN